MITQGAARATGKAGRVCGWVIRREAGNAGRRSNAGQRITAAAEPAEGSLVGDGFFGTQAGVGADLEFGEFFFAGGVAFT